VKKLLAALALVVISCFWWASAEEVNLAKNCKVEACGYNSNGGLTGTEVENPELAVDGNADTKWDCNVKTHDELADSGKLHWIMLDLGSQKEFNKIVLKHASNTTIDKDFPTYNTRQMTLEYSNDKSNWTQFLTILNGDQKPVNTRYFDKITARYIRLNIQISGTIDTDARIAEIEVYNSSETPVKEGDVPLNATTTATVSSSSTAPAQTSPSSVSGTSSSAPVSPVLLIIVVLVVVIFVAVAVVCAVWVLKKTGSNN